MWNVECKPLPFWCLFHPALGGVLKFISVKTGQIEPFISSKSE
jgi:hypothetical protein